MTMTLVGLRTTSGAHQPQSAWVFEVLRSLRPQASRRLSCQATPRDLWLVDRAQPGLAPEKPRNHPTTEVPNGPKHPAEPDKKGPRALSRRSGYHHGTTLLSSMGTIYQEYGVVYSPYNH